MSESTPNRGDVMDEAVHDAVEERISAAITSVKDEFLAAHEDLTRQLEEANQRLMRLLGMVSGGSLSGKSTATATNNVDMERLRHELVERDLALAATSKHAAELEAAVTEFKSEIAQLRSRETWIVAANQDLSERLVVLRAEEKTNAKVLSKANEEIERLTKQLAEREQALDEAARQLEHAQRMNDEVRQVSKRLTREAAGLNRENARLRQALSTADSTSMVRDRQQRILLESLMVNGHLLKLGEILLSADVISQDQLLDALGEQKVFGDRMVGEILLNKGHVEEEDVAQTIACQMHLPLVQLCEQTVQPDAARIVDDILCTNHRCIPIRVTAEKLFVAMANPRDEQAVRAIEQASGRRVVALVATPSDVRAAIRRVFCI